MAPAVSFLSLTAIVMLTISILHLQHEQATANFKLPNGNVVAKGLKFRAQPQTGAYSCFGWTPHCFIIVYIFKPPSETKRYKNYVQIQTTNFPGIQFYSVTVLYV